MQHQEESFPKEEMDDNEKREEQRRRKESEGYTYITTVGWICRREKSRRKDDEFMF